MHRGFLALLIATGTISPPSALAARYENRVVDLAPPGESFGGIPEGQEPSVSADGRFVAFTEAVEEGQYDIRRIFLRDRETERTVLVSRRTGRKGRRAEADSEMPVVSPDGRFVAFASDDDSLVPGDKPGKDVFVRDLQRGVTDLVSQPSGLPSAPGRGESQGPSLSDDGRFVAFSSDSVPPSFDGQGKRDVFVRDRRLHRTELISRASGASGLVGDRDSAEDFGDECCYDDSPPSISGDGRFVAFSSSSTNFDPLDADDNNDVFIRDRATATTELVGRGDGRPGKNPVADTRSPSLSADGRRIAFVSRSPLAAGQTGPTLQVWVRNLDTGRTVLASRRTGVNGRRGSAAAYEPHLSRTGRVVVFSTTAKNLVGDRSDLPGAVWRDLRANRTEWVDRGRGAHGPPSDSEIGMVGVDPAVSGDGRFVAFASDEATLSEECKAGPAVLIRDLLGPRRRLPPRRLRVCSLRTAGPYRDGREIDSLYTFFNRTVTARYTVYRRSGRALTRVRTGILDSVGGSAGYFDVRLKVALRPGHYVLQVRGRDGRGQVASRRAPFRVLAARRP